MTLSTYSFEQEKCRPMFPWTRNTEAEAHAAPHARETVNLKRFIHMTQPHPSRPKALRLRKSTTGTILSTMQRFGRRLRAPSPAVREWESARREPESTARNAKPDGTRGTTRNAKPDGPPTHEKHRQRSAQRVAKKSPAQKGLPNGDPIRQHIDD